MALLLHPQRAFAELAERTACGWLGVAAVVIMRTDRLAPIEVPLHRGRRAYNCPWLGRRGTLMPTIEINGARIHYEDTGAGDETVVLSHGLLWSTRMFDPQVEALRDRYRVITYDHRGQGRSSVPSESVIPIDLLYADAVALVEKLGVGPCHFGGLSMGGFVAMRVAARRPDLVRSCILLETSAEPEPAENVPKYRLLTAVVKRLGARPVTGQVLPIMFAKSTLEDPGRAGDVAQWKASLQGLDRSIHKAVAGVLERPGVVDELGRITAPTLVIVGEEDVATTPAKAENIVSHIEGAELVRIPEAGHTSTLEQPERVSEAIRGFLERL